MRCHGMRGRRKKDTDGPMEALRKYGQEEGGGIRAEVVWEIGDPTLRPGPKAEAVWERGDPVWTQKVPPFTRVIQCPDRVSMVVFRPGFRGREAGAGLLHIVLLQSTLARESSEKIQRGQEIRRDDNTVRNGPSNQYDSAGRLCTEDAAAPDRKH